MTSSPFKDPLYFCILEFMDWIGELYTKPLDFVNHNTPQGLMWLWRDYCENYADRYPQHAEIFYSMIERVEPEQLKFGNLILWRIVPVIA